MIKRLLAGLLVGMALSSVALPASAAVDNNQDALNTFLDSGEVTDRGLQDGLSCSGWPADEVREGMNKSYNVDFIGVSRFLYSDAGVKFLKNPTTSYYAPYLSINIYAVQTLRSAILADARDGQISAKGIINALPTGIRLANFCNPYTGSQNVCAEGRCQGDVQCLSLLAWYVFLPACIQANQLTDPSAAPRLTPVPLQQ